MNAKAVPTGSLLLILLAACAQQPARTSASAASHHTQIDYARYIVRPVGEFSFSSLYDWDSNDPNHAVVWVSPIEAYRLTLLGVCFDLQNAPTILLTSHNGQVNAGLDSIIVRNDRCAIQAIDKLDAKAIKEARRVQRGGS
ncbi:MAG TPA: DUF6491 family protein [Rhodanobacteraceae bacterium]|nr:DUF6491 family protein [Rhodanobacteraceae bacterium]